MAWTLLSRGNALGATEVAARQWGYPGNEAMKLLRFDLIVPSPRQASSVAESMVLAKPKPYLLHL